MTSWNWTLPDWPDFQWDAQKLAPLESRFAHDLGLTLGVFHTLGGEDQDRLVLSVISEEAFKTSEIEGEYLSRDSLQSSIARHLGLKAEASSASAAENGVAQVMSDLYRNFDAPMRAETLHRWHGWLMAGRRDLETVGAYRRHSEPMRVVSGPSWDPKVHFEAPPSARVPQEMARFLDWFNGSAPGQAHELSALVRAGTAHLYFESIHPYEDGNGRIGRAISEKALAQAFGRPTLIALSRTIEARRKLYYEALHKGSLGNEITPWLLSFAQMALEARQFTESQTRFLVGKARFFDRYGAELNDRQKKAVLRMFREGPEGFEGGMSAEKYIAITGASRATATRDLSDLVRMGAFQRSGELRHTRYALRGETADHPASG